MTIYTNIIKSDGPAGSAGTVLGTQSISAPSTWTRLTSLDNTVPAGGAILEAYSDAEAFRVAIMDAVSAQDTAAADRAPRDSGTLIAEYGGVTAHQLFYIEKGSQVWVKKA